MIPAIAAVFAVTFVLLYVYIRHWMARMLPVFWRPVRILANFLTLILAGTAVCFFTTPGLILLHFWLISALWEIPLAIYRTVRRRFPSRSSRVIVPALATLALVVWGAFNIAHPVQRYYPIASPKPLQRGYRIALLTDIHYDTVQNPAALEAVIPEINALQPDFVVLGGDIVEEGTSKERMEEVFSVLSRLESPFGTYYVYGNHDRQNYSRSPRYTVEELNAAMERSGITILQSSYVSINDELILAGMEDPSWNAQPRVPASQVLEGADLDRLVLIADHQPNDWRANSAAGMDIQLSGHTHAGQIWPVGQFLELAGGLSYGRYDRDGCIAVVSSGFAGWGYRIRTSACSEYVIIDILRDAA